MYLWRQLAFTLLWGDDYTHAVSSNRRLTDDVLAVNMVFVGFNILLNIV